MKKISLYITLLMALMVSSCTITYNNAEKESVKGDFSKTYDLKGFNAMSLAGHADITFVQDSVYKVVVNMDEDKFDELKVEVKDSTLCISQEGKKSVSLNILHLGNSNSIKISMEVHAPDLTKLNIAGACDFNTDKLNTSDLKVRLSGAGDITIGSIMAHTIDINVSGAGDIDMKETNVEETKISISGAGNVDLDCKDCGLVKTSVAGAGSITVKGNVRELQKSLSGVGSVDTDGLKIEK